MKDTLKLIFITLIFISCKDTNYQDEKSESSLSFLNQERIIYYENDSVLVHPFELFNVVKFKSIENEMHLDLVFDIIDSIQKTKINLYSSNVEYKNIKSTDTTIYIFGDRLLAKGEVSINNYSATVKLKTDEGYITRKIVIGTYKVIYGYFSDSEFHRIDPASDAYADGYYIVDIVPINNNTKFEREKNKN